MTLLDISAIVGMSAALVVVCLLLLLIARAFMGMGRLAKNIRLIAKKEYVDLCLECEKRGLIDTEELNSILASAKDGFNVNE